MADFLDSEAESDVSESPENAMNRSKTSFVSSFWFQSIDSGDAGSEWNGENVWICLWERIEFVCQASAVVDASSVVRNKPHWFLEWNFSGNFDFYSSGIPMQSIWLEYSAKMNRPSLFVS